MTDKEALNAVDRIYVLCDEIDPDSGYRVLDDINALRDYIGNRGKVEDWELVYHDDHPSYYAHYVTAKCPKCGEWFFGNKELLPNVKDCKYGAKLWSGFCANYGEKTKSLFKMIALDAAESERAKLPKYCQNCGARLGKEVA